MSASHFRPWLNDLSENKTQMIITLEILAIGNLLAHVRLDHMATPTISLVFETNFLSAFSLLCDYLIEHKHLCLSVRWILRITP